MVKSIPKMVRLANGEFVRSELMLHGETGLARAWGYKVNPDHKGNKSVQKLVAGLKKLGLTSHWLRAGRTVDLTGADGVRVVGYINNPRGAYCMTAWDAMEIYRLHVLETKIRSPWAPGNVRRPGSRNWGYRPPFKNAFDEATYQQHIAEEMQLHLEHERYLSVGSDYRQCRCEWCEEARQRNFDD